MTIFAHTELAYQGYPGYVNLSERVSNPGDVVITVRSPGQQDSSSLILNNEQLQAFVDKAQNYLNRRKV